MTASSDALGDNSNTNTNNNDDSSGERGSRVARLQRQPRVHSGAMATRERERGTFGHINCGIPRRLPPVLGDSGSAHRHRFVSGSIFSSRHADGSDRSAVACGTRARHERGLGHRAPGPARGPTYGTNDAARLAIGFSARLLSIFTLTVEILTVEAPSLALSPRR